MAGYAVEARIFSTGKIMAKVRLAHEGAELGQRDPEVPIAKRLANVLGVHWTRFYEDEETLVGGEKSESWRNKYKICD